MSNGQPPRVEVLQAARKQIMAELETARATFQQLHDRAVNAGPTELNTLMLHQRFQAGQTVKALEAQLVELDEMEG